MKFMTSLMALILVPVFSYASEVTVVNPSNKASPATVFGMAYNDAIGGRWYQAADCQDANRVFNSTPNSVMIYNSSNEFAARNKGLDCRLDTAKYKSVIYIGESYMSICRLPGKTNELGSNLNVLGIASMYAVKRHEDNFKQAGANVKLVPYGGSKDVIAALRAGDITLGWIGASLASKQGDKLQCLYSTDPSSPMFLGNKLKLEIPDFRIITVIYTNADDPKVIKSLFSAQKNEKFSTFLTTSYTNGKWSPSSADTKAVTEYVDRMQKSWAPK